MVVVEPGDALEVAERDAGVVPVEEGVPGVGVLLDVVLDTEPGEDVVELVGGSTQSAAATG